MFSAVEQLVRWHSFPDTASMQDAASRWIIDTAAAAIGDRRRFSIVLAGGNTPRAVYSMLRDAQTDWPRWDVWIGDERCAPLDDPERNSVMARTALLDHVPIPPDRIHLIRSELGADAAAKSYADELQEVADFDLVLLGLGEDGHTASLFPDHDWGTDSDAPGALAVFDAPKPPPQRVSMSAARLSRARQVLFLVEGRSKSEALARWRAHEKIPADVIRPASGVDVMIAG